MYIKILLINSEFCFARPLSYSKKYSAFFFFCYLLCGIFHFSIDDSHLSWGGHGQGGLTATCHLPDVQPIQCLYHLRLQLSIRVSMTKLSYISSKALYKNNVHLKMYIYVCIFLIFRCYKILKNAITTLSNFTGTWQCFT